MSADLVRALVDAFNEQHLDAFESLLDPEVEVLSRKGPRVGPAAVLDWATMSGEGDLVQRIEVDELREHGDNVIAFARRQWLWREDREVADESPDFILFRFRGGRLLSWQPFADRESALAAAGLD